MGQHQGRRHTDHATGRHLVDPRTALVVSRTVCSLARVCGLAKAISEMAKGRMWRRAGTTMIRKAIIAVLTLAAVGTSVAWVSVPSAPDGFLRYLTATRESKLHVIAYQGDAVLCYGNFPQRQSMPPVEIMKHGFDWGVL